jgi:hypothetical protein
MSLDPAKLHDFLDYKKSKIDSVVKAEAGRLGDLKHARDTVFKYALPASVIDGVASGISSLITGQFWIMLPAALFIILIYLLADKLDRQKYAERIDIIGYTEMALFEIRIQEIELLRRS